MATQTIRNHHSSVEGSIYATLTKKWLDDFKGIFDFLGEKKSYDIPIARGVICDAIMRFTISEFQRPQLIEQVYRYHRQALKIERKDAKQLWFPMVSSECDALARRVGIDPKNLYQEELPADSIVALTQFFVKYLESVRLLSEKEFQVFAGNCINRARQLEASHASNDTFLLLENIDTAVIDRFESIRGESKLDFVLRSMAGLALAA